MHGLWTSTTPPSLHIFTAHSQSSQPQCYSFMTPVDPTGVHNLLWDCAILHNLYSATLKLCSNLNWSVCGFRPWFQVNFDVVEQHIKWSLLHISMPMVKPWTFLACKSNVPHKPHQLKGQGVGSKHKSCINCFQITSPLARHKRSHLKTRNYLLTHLPGRWKQMPAAQSTWRSGRTEKWVHSWSSQPMSLWQMHRTSLESLPPVDIQQQRPVSKHKQCEN